MLRSSQYSTHTRSMTTMYKHALHIKYSRVLYMLYLSSEYGYCNVLYN